MKRFVKALAFGLTLCLLCLFLPRPVTGITVPTAGDVNGDGAVNSADVILLLQYLAGSGSIQTRCADVNADDAVNSADALLLTQYLAGYDVKLKLPPDNEWTEGVK